jgi:hypothetical protein
MASGAPSRIPLRLLLPLLASIVAACGSSGGSASQPPDSRGSGSDPIFTAPNVWTQPVDASPVHPQSASMIGGLVSLGGFGLGRFQVDFSLVVLEAAAATPAAAFARSPGYYLPDCDSPSSLPLPAGGAIEGQAGYACDVGANDCHLLVVDRAASRLHEVYQATVDASGVLHGQCAISWNLTTSYPADMRGDQCTSADAAGLPIAPLLFSADEIAAGSIDHAIRFILPNSRIRAGVFVHPASHAGAPSGPATTVPYGARLRLRADYPVASLPAPARVVARALQRYGMILADGGNVALTARDDRFTVHKWAEVGFDSHSLQAITAADFQVVDHAAPIALTYDCVRNAK